MVELGVMTSPAVVLGSKVLVAGRIPKAEEMRQILQQALGE
jgi:protein-disulfide isomerase